MESSAKAPEPPPSEGVFERFNVSRESARMLDRYAELLLHWQKRVSLIGASTVPQLWERHIADSLQLLSLLPPDCRAIADLGSGAGIPGLVLAIAGKFTAHLYEANGKKTAFLRETIRQTGASAMVHQQRIEVIRESDVIPIVQAVTARALAPLPRLLTLAEPFLQQGAIGIFPKGHDVDAELTDSAKSWHIHYERHKSLIDSRGVILVIKEAHRDQPAIG